jgi:hypothetical protein
MFLFNTMLGEELLFRGYPSAHERRLKRGDWVANGPPRRLPPARALASPNAPGHVHDLVPDEAVSEHLIGIAVHSAQMPSRYSSSRSSSEKSHCISQVL